MTKAQIEAGKHWLKCQREDDAADGVGADDVGLDALETAIAVYEYAQDILSDWERVDRAVNRSGLAEDRTSELRRALDVKSYQKMEEDR